MTGVQTCALPIYTAKKLENNLSTTNVEFNKVGENSYEGFFDYTSLSTLIADLSGTKNQSVLTLNNNNLVFYLDLDNYYQLTKAIPFLADPNFEPFGPEYNDSVSCCRKRVVVIIFNNGSFLKI